VRLRGRIDGVLEQPERLLLEEIKTVTRPLREDPPASHWAQLKLYAALFKPARSFPQIELQLTYLELDRRDTREYRQCVTPSEAGDFLNATLQYYGSWLEDQSRWTELRDASIARLAFPHSQYRPGQRALAVAAYRAVRRRQRLFVEAPTGLGKTVAVLFPVIKALGERLFEKIFFLTAKTLGRAAAEQNLAVLRQAGLRLRSLTLTARETLCALQPQPCDPRACPRAIGFYDRYREALRSALCEDILDGPRFSRLADQHQVCPFELSLAAAEWMDIIVGDYNHVFDPRVSLKRLLSEEAGPCIILVDEAHNLLERGREMYSADLDRREWARLKKVLPRGLPVIRDLEALGRAWSRWRNSLAPESAPAQADLELPWLQSSPPAADRTGPYPEPNRDPKGPPTIVARRLPGPVLERLHRFLRSAEECLLFEPPADSRRLLLDIYFQALDFARVSDRFDERYVLLAENLKGAARLRLRCLDPARDLRQSLPHDSAAVFFSGTLTPLVFFRQALGGEPQDPVLQLDSPFPAEHLQVLVQDRIPTRWRERTATYDRVTEAILAFVEGHHGNYLVFFPSYDYLNEILLRFEPQARSMTVQRQRPGMDEPERRGFVAAFSQERAGSLVGFAVLGGFFGESIDLVGEHLTGAVIVSVGLPQVGLDRELIGHYFKSIGLSGFDYAYRFPGMNRVLQAAGRIIRSETDRGCLLLIDPRFAEPAYRQLLPRWWQVRRVGSGSEIREAVRQFWSGSASRPGKTG
jgi:Rad3-related DNA helicase